MCVHQVDIADIEGKVAQVNSGSGAGAWNRPQQLTSRLSRARPRRRTWKQSGLPAFAAPKRRDQDDGSQGAYQTAYCGEKKL